MRYVVGSAYWAADTRNAAGDSRGRALTRSLLYLCVRCARAACQQKTLGLANHTASTGDDGDRIIYKYWPILTLDTSPSSSLAKASRSALCARVCSAFICALVCTLYNRSCQVKHAHASRKSLSRVPNNSVVRFVRTPETITTFAFVHKRNERRRPPHTTLLHTHKKRIHTHPSDTRRRRKMKTSALRTTLSNLIC